MAATEPCILVTGGAGYIGSHTVVELVEAGMRVHIVDNLCNSSEIAIQRVKELVAHPEWVTYSNVDVCDAAALDAVFAAHSVSAVIHFAALKAVGESISKPLDYYRNNIGGLLNVLDCMTKHGVDRIVFSSSATVYGSGKPPFSETSPTGTGILNPYGWSKFMGEQILRDWQRARPSASVVLLRYFNPVGAHASGRIGEDPSGVPNNLMPYIQRVAVGRLPALTVHGKDYDTPDGTAQRDYIHVVDLARGHVSALRFVAARGAGAGGCDVFNLGTGVRVSVLEVVAAYERASGRSVAVQFGPRRAGDAEAVWADASKAAAELHWTATRGLDDMCVDSWRWVSANPDGFK